MKRIFFHRWAVALALLSFAGFLAGQEKLQPHPRRTPAKIPARELGRQLANSLDAGDSYSTADGPKRLRRLAGVVAVKLPPDQSLQQRLTAKGSALAGYEAAKKPVRGFTLFESAADEKRRQLATATAHRQVMQKARSAARSQTVNPVFVDPENGLRMLATEQVVIGLKPGVNPEDHFGRSWKNVRPIWGAPDQFLLTLPGYTAEQVFAESSRRARHKDVAWAEPNFIRQAVKCSAPIPNDFYFDNQWHLDNFGQYGATVGADAKLLEAWAVTTGRSNVVIAILDDGVDLDHPDLAANIFVNTGEIEGNNLDDDNNGVADDVNGYDFYADFDYPTPYDPEDNHGTAIAGIAAAVGDNSEGIAGAAYGCQLLPIKIIEGEYVTDDATLAAAVRYAAGFNANGVRTWRGADILNISLLLGQSQALHIALNDAATKGRDGRGCLIFAAAGNFASAWQPFELTIPQSGTYTLRWEYSKDSVGSDGADTVWLDGVTFPDGSTESFQDGVLPTGWTTSPGAPWSNVREGVNGNRALIGWDGPNARSLRAGAIGNDQTTYVEVTKQLEPGLLIFWMWVSSERDYDMFRFWVNTNEVGGFSESGVPLPDTPVGYPASHPACFAVGSSTDFDYRSDYSQYGTALDFLAPSDGGIATIFTTDRMGTDGYSFDGYAEDFGGTSASTPLAAGVAALVLSANPNLWAGDVRNLMRDTCDRIGDVTYTSAGRNTFYGSGRINAGRAVRNARVDLSVSIASSTSLANVGGLVTHTITVRNNGATWSGPFTLTGLLSAGTAFVSSSPSPLSHVGNTLVFTNTGLEPEWTATYRVTASNTALGSQTFTAIAANDAIEANPEDNATIAITSVLPVPTVSISDATQNEGNRGSSNMLFAVTLSNPSVSPVTVSYATATNTARAGADYSTRRGKMTFAPGQTNLMVSVRVVGDARNEADEDFFVNLSAPVNATLDRAQGVGTILNDDPLPQVSMADVTVTEGNAGLRNAVFKARLSAASGREVTVNFATASGSAVAGRDFVATNGLVKFAAGKVSQNIIIKVIGDSLQESNLTFLVELQNPVNAVLSNAYAQGTIRNNDRSPKLYINDVTLVEGDTGTTNALFNVRLVPASGLAVAVSFTTTNGSASSESDYTATNGVIEFAPGETNQWISVPVTADLLNEVNETFQVRLLAATNALLADPLGLATVVNDDPLPVLSIQAPTTFWITNVFEYWIEASAYTLEPEAGFTNLDFNVTLSAPSGRPVSVKYKAVNGSARAGSNVASADFLSLASSGLLTFQPGVTSQSISIVVLANETPEADESFSLVLSGVVNASLAQAHATGVILGELGPEAVSLTAASTPSLEIHATLEASGCRIAFATTAGVRYRVERCRDLSSQSVWLPLPGAENLVGHGGVMEFIDVEASSQPQNFYRVIQLP